MKQHSYTKKGPGRYNRKGKLCASGKKDPKRLRKESRARTLHEDEASRVLYGYNPWYEKKKVIEV